MMSLDPLLRPRSVAVVGASERAGSVGDQTIKQLLGGRFSGDVFAVNPRYEKIHGLRALSSMEALESPVDLAVLAVGNDQLEAEMEKAIGIGARSVAIFASCHGEARSGGSLRERLRALADDAGIPICGGNGMGFVNVEDRTRVCGFYQPPNLTPGGVTFLTHSGSLFSAMLHNRRGIRFNLVVSTGLEINTAMDAYMRWALALDSTRVLALFLETIRDPDGFSEALGEAARRDIPVVALKIGASQRGGEAVRTHSEGLAGDDAVYEALFEAHGVHRVVGMDEMADTVELFGAGRSATGSGLGAVHDSGGERALVIDTADRVGVPIPEIGRVTSDRLARTLDPGLEPANPVDAWGTGRDSEAVFVECLLALADDPAIGALVLCVDLTPEEEPDEAYSRAALTVSESTAKPVAVLCNMATTVDPIQAGFLRDRGVPVLEGTENGLRAIKHLLDRHQRSSLPALGERLTSVAVDTTVDFEGEAAGLALLAAYGISTPSVTVAHDQAGVLAAADERGYPLVLKTAEPIDHKTDVGGVVVGIADEAAALAAYADLSSRLGPRVMVSEQVPSGVEIGLGMVTDEQFGPVILISAGGTLIELLSDRAALLPPVDKVRALRALDRIQIRPLLDGYRHYPPADLDALAELISRFSELASDSAGIIDSIDVNPVIAGPQGSVAVDALIRARR